MCLIYLISYVYMSIYTHIYMLCMYVVKNRFLVGRKEKREKKKKKEKFVYLQQTLMYNFYVISLVF